MSRKRVSTQHNPRARKRARHDGPDDENEDPNESQGGTPGPSNASQTDMPEVNPGMSQQELYEANRRLQARCNELSREQREASRDALADRTNGADLDDSQDEEVVDIDEKKFIKALGKKFCNTHFIWVPHPDEVYGAELDPDYNPLDRFSRENQPQNRIQGALRELRETIPEEYHDAEEFAGWVSSQHGAGVKAERERARNRMRANPSLFGRTLKEWATPEQREAFMELIGRRPVPNKPDEYYYDTYNVPLLHEDYDGSFDIDKIFLNELLFITHALLTKGVTGGTELATGKTAPPVEANEKLWGLKKTTPGMIAGAAVWLRFAHSRDETFEPVGAITGIDWQAEHEAYLNWLHTGLQSKTDCVLNIFRRWDERFYPHSEEATAQDAEMIQVVQDSQDAAIEALRARSSQAAS
ncbi:hypothetical protein GGX14DRAFT_390888 [Mycena pura]|uniref:Uncharacterized protein n=1 Tax=Mycena pura TaxID=153505 RepID=A0AAD6VNF5_9AGAR|nr:hypothetical protein GGX14DRAFT_390888 [Mycena pura]